MYRSKITEHIRGKRVTTRSRRGLMRFITDGIEMLPIPWAGKRRMAGKRVLFYQPTRRVRSVHRRVKRRRS